MCEALAHGDGRSSCALQLGNLLAPSWLQPSQCIPRSSAVFVVVYIRQKESRNNYPHNAAIRSDTA
eukprot:2815148-Prymnesium_polylepis.2